MSDTPQPVHPAPLADTLVPLDGGWFRRERERVALGRKRVAERLGITESKLAVLESRKQSVPTEWLPILASLEFRLPTSAPAVVTPSAESGGAETEKTRPSDTPNSIPPAPVVTAPPVVASSAVMPTMTPSTPALTPAPVSTTAPALVANQPVSVTAGTAATQSFFCGHWLRARRTASSLRLDQVLTVLGCSETELLTMEEHNIRLPLRYISKLQKLALLSSEEARVAAKLPSTARLDGIWLSRQRAQLRMTREQLGSALHASAASIDLIESKAWPLPAAWISIVESLQKARGAGTATAPLARPFVRSYSASRRHGSPLPPPAASGVLKAKEPSAAPVAKEAAPSTPVSKPVAPRPASVSPTSSPPVAPVKTTPTVLGSQGGLAESIVDDRMRFGKRAGLSANQVLSLIAQDFLVAKIQIPLSHDAVAAAMRTLLTHKPGPV